MALIVDACYELSTRPASDAKKEDATKVWSDTLFEIIPEDKLHHAFHLAFDNHKSPNPISAYELKAAWEEIKGNLETNASTHSEKIASCREAHLHNNPAGTVSYVDPFHYERDIDMPSATCQPEAFDRARMAHAKAENILAAHRATIAGFNSETKSIFEWAIEQGLKIKEMK